MNKAEQDVMILEANRTQARIEVLNRLRKRINGRLENAEKSKKERGRQLMLATGRSTDAEIKIASDVLDLAAHRVEDWKSALDEVDKILAEVTPGK